ncbi:hypothetical protein KCP74_00280 [Salmonella enterica subsp. enterica]|nr:hypothetical protein KCP74_00280 [Salmonella enterica subsp. enterica]
MGQGRTNGINPPSAFANFSQRFAVDAQTAAGRASAADTNLHPGRTGNNRSLHLPLSSASSRSFDQFAPHGHDYVTQQILFLRGAIDRIRSWRLRPACVTVRRLNPGVDYAMLRVNTFEVR